MNGWAGFWIGCGLAVIGIGLIVIADAVERGAALLAKAYLDTFTDDDNQKEKDNVQ